MAIAATNMPVSGTRSTSPPQKGPSVRASRLSKVATRLAFIRRADMASAHAPESNETNLHIDSPLNLDFRRGTISTPDRPPRL